MTSRPSKTASAFATVAAAGLGLSSALAARGQGVPTRAEVPPLSPYQIESSLSTPLRDSELALISKLHHDSRVMLDASRILQDGSENRDVAKLATKVSRDHQADMHALEGLAHGRGAQLQTPLAKAPDAQRALVEQQTEMARLGSLRGDALDQAYLELLLAQHELFTAQARVGLDESSDEQVRSVLRELLGTCDEHVALAERVQIGLAHDPAPALPNESDEAEDDEQQEKKEQSEPGEPTEEVPPPGSQPGARPQP
jgi:uncharacterized protein (DUF305 family)